MSKAFFSALIFLSFAINGVLAQDTLKRDPLEPYIDSVAYTYTQQSHTHALAIGIVHHNRAQTFFYGETVKENATLPTEETIYEIGSMTQIFTATLLADVVEKG
ncbi:serine hydrolase, partial [Parapusillimonas sp. SGNA-6]|nr:serine hydrolase [Parapusillimonas sp. SGNA-6]